MIQRLLRAYYAGRLQSHRRLFERLLADKDSGVAIMVNNHANEIAMKMVMRWLENKRIRHCAACPSTETLRRLRDKFWCPPHYIEAEKALIEYERKEKEKATAAA